MQITVPEIGSNPLRIDINGVSYFLEAGATVTVPDAVGYEIQRMLQAKSNPAPVVEKPFGDASLKTAVDSLETRMTAVEAAVQVDELPPLPTTDGEYSLLLTMDKGEGVLTWEEEETPST